MKGATSPRKLPDCWRSNFIAKIRELYREDKVSLGRAAELCETPLAAFMDFVAKHGVPPLRYSFEDLDEERRSTDRIEV